MLQLRPNVSLWNLQAQGLFILQVVEKVFEAQLGPSVACIVTSGADGKHMEGSYHSRGLAFDFSLSSVFVIGKNALAKHVALALGGSGVEAKLSEGTFLYDGGDFDVLAENLGGNNEHLHVEWDARRAAKRVGKGPPAALEPIDPGFKLRPAPDGKEV
jgi:hypothetical protein